MVIVPVGLTDLDDNSRGQRSEILKALVQNYRRRTRAEHELSEAREELSVLLRRGVSLPSPLKVAVMAREARISRETAHKLLRRIERV